VSLYYITPADSKEGESDDAVTEISTVIAIILNVLLMGALIALIFRGLIRKAMEFVMQKVSAGSSVLSTGSMREWERDSTINPMFPSFSEAPGGENMELELTHGFKVDEPQGNGATRLSVCDSAQDAEEIEETGTESGRGVRDERNGSSVMTDNSLLLSSSEAAAGDTFVEFELAHGLQVTQYEGGGGGEADVRQGTTTRRSVHNPMYEPSRAETLSGGDTFEVVNPLTTSLGSVHAVDDNSGEESSSYQQPKKLGTHVSSVMRLLMDTKTNGGAAQEQHRVGAK